MKNLIWILFIFTMLSCSQQPRQEIGNHANLRKSDKRTSGKTYADTNTPVVMSMPQTEVQDFYGEEEEMEISLDVDVAEMQEIIEEKNTEDYQKITENQFLSPANKPLSTFSIDVDVASYANIRRFLEYGQTPPKDAVRIEEMINYFDYNYPQPTQKHPFKIMTEVGDCPWTDEHKLVHIGIQGKDVPSDNLPPSNLVFLIDVSGSMSDNNKLPLLKSSLKMLVNKKLRSQDKVAIVVYAGAAGVVLEPTNNKEKIIKALNRLNAGGSTAGGEGIELAYKLAEKYKTSDSNNRIILATDGDFNVGMSSNSEMERLIEKKRETGIFLTVLGFGMGNYQDSKMEILADKGNGNYAYIDKIAEAQKVFLKEFGGTLFTIAKDVKIQVEFNPAVVKAYRLIGYENRALADKDFNDDKKDAGDLGSGHTVTAIYEIIPTGTKSAENFDNKVDKLKYQQTEIKNKASKTDEMLTLKLRYKLPDEDKSTLLVETVKNESKSFEKTSENFRFSASVAQFGMLLRDSEFKGNSSPEMVLKMAQNSKGNDLEGYRHEFMKLVKSYRDLN